LQIWHCISKILLAACLFFNIIINHQVYMFPYCDTIIQSRRALSTKKSPAVELEPDFRLPTSDFRLLTPVSSLLISGSEDRTEAALRALTTLFVAEGFSPPICSSQPSILMHKGAPQARGLPSRNNSIFCLLSPLC
jgi:hypothetical protein